MNQQQRSAYGAKNERRIKLFERQFLRPMYNALQNEFVRAAQLVKRGEIGRINDMLWVDGVAEIITDIHSTAGVYYAAKTMHEINQSSKEQKGFGIDPAWIALIQEYFRTKLLNKAVLPISETTRGNILSIISQGVEEGWSIDRMAFELEHSDLPLWRARMIVRTEILQAQNVGTQLGAEESEFETQKEWISAHDFRVRHTHSQVDGQVVDEQGRFKVPRKKGGFDFMTGPGDPTASAGNIINCRCSSAVTAKRDANGRLIRKRKISVLLPGAIKPFRQVVTI